MSNYISKLILILLASVIFVSITGTDKSLLSAAKNSLQHGVNSVEKRQIP